MRIHGRHGEVSIGTGSPLTVIGSLNAWTLNMARDYVEVTSFGDANKTYVPGLQDISGTLSGFYDLDTGSPSTGESEPLFDAAEGDEPVVLKLTPNSLDPAHYWTGPAYLDVSVNVAVNGAVTLSGNFKAAGAWSRS